MPFEAVLSRQLALLAEHLTSAAAEDSQVLAGQVADLTSARDRFRTRADELTALNDALSLELDARTIEREAAAQATAALETERQRASQFVAQVAALQEQVSALEAERDTLAASTRTLRTSADAHSRELETANAQAADAAAARDREAAVRSTLEDEIVGLRTRLAAVRGEFEAETARLRTDAAATRTSAEQELAMLRERVAAAQAAHRDRLAGHLATTFEDIGRGTSVDDVLSAAANGLADDFARVGVFVAAGGKLEARYQRGFDQTSGIERTTVVLGDGSLLARAAASPELGLHVVDALTDLPFSGTPSLVITAPVMVRGELLALMYADNDGQQTGDDGSTPARIADIVRRHTALRLDRLTLELKTTGELRSYAKMLLDEVEYVYRADVSARKQDGDRLERLTENLRCARQIFHQRAAVDGPAMSALIEEVLTAMVTAKSATPFGRELASVASAAHPAVPQAV